MKVSEWFYSIQGEGVTAGKPSLFIRFPGCNFRCGTYPGDTTATWTCDSEAIWTTSRSISTDDLMTEIFTKYPKLKDWIAARKATIVFTGGEPTLPHNIKAIEEIRKWLHDRNIQPYYEVETNASIAVNFKGLFHQVNASPKLANSGMPGHIRQNVDVINLLKEHPNAWFKFVVNTDEDIREIEDEWIGTLGVPEDRILLMPGCDRLENLQSTSLFAAEKAIEHCWGFSSRLQISIWDRLTGC